MDRREVPANRRSGGDRNPMSKLEGRWRVERLSGMLPPMVGVSKEILGERGKTRLGPLLSLPFQIEKREDCIVFVYPSSMLVDEIRYASEDSWVGRAVLAGYELGRFRIVRTG